MEKSKDVHAPPQNIGKKNEAEKIKEKLLTRREKRKLEEKFSKTKSLVDSDDEDAADWYQRVKNKKEVPRKRNHDFNEKKPHSEAKRRKENKHYSSKDLKGLAIGHKADTFKEGHQIVLILRDKGVLDNEEDVLENVNMVDEKKANKNVENKIKKPLYRPYDDEEFEDFESSNFNSLLSKYDEEINGPQEEIFRIGENFEKKNDTNDNNVSKGVSLTLPDFKIANDYYTPEEMLKFKKSSKKKGQIRQRKNKSIIFSNDAQHLIENENTDSGSRTKKQKTEDVIKMKFELNKIEDDDDLIGPEDDLSSVVIDDEAEEELQSSLHKTRILKLFEKKNFDRSEDILKLVGQKLTDQKQEMEVDEQSVDEDGQIILNATAEFCRNLGDIPTFVDFEKIKEEEKDDIEMKKQIHDNKNSQFNRKHSNNWNEVDVVKEENMDSPIYDQPILEEEPDVSLGVAGALKLAMNKGYLDKEVSKPVGANRVSSLISAQKYTIEEKFYEDDRAGRRDRYSGSLAEFREKDGYKPDFKLDYVDEKGRMMNQKEAFRYLSHKFHGKGPGKNKVDKRMKKMEQESKLRQMNSTDTPLNTVKLLQDKQKEQQTPFVVLSGPRSNSSNSVPKISKK